MGYEGYMTENEYRCLRRYAAKAAVGIMDVGTFNGASAREMRVAAPENVPVWTIDYFPIDTGHERSPMNIVHENFDGLKDIFIIVGDSHSVGRFWQTPIDRLVLDGSHTYDGVAGDFNLFTKSLVPGGVVILHDALNGNIAFRAVNRCTVQANPGVCDFLSEIISEDWELVDSVDTIAVVKRLNHENIDVGK